MLRAALLVPALLLAGCNGEGTTISFDAKSDGGNTLVNADVNGHVAIKAPGFEGSFKLPKIQIDAADFDVNGVKLYPGSTIRDFNIQADERVGRKDEGKLSIAFDAPAPLATVQAWFRDNMAQRGFKVEPNGTGFTGTTNDGEPIAIELDADGADKVKGRMRVGA